MHTLYRWRNQVPEWNRDSQTLSKPRIGAGRLLWLWSQSSHHSASLTFGLFYILYKPVGMWEEVQTDRHDTGWEARSSHPNPLLWSRNRSGYKLNMGNLSPILSTDMCWKSTLYQDCSSVYVWDVVDGLQRWQPMIPLYLRAYTTPSIKRSLIPFLNLGWPWDLLWQQDVTEVRLCQFWV